MESLFQDLRYTFRMLLNRPAFAGIVVLTLGLGIGANSAIFTVVNSVLLRPLPFKEPDQLVRLFLAKRSNTASTWSLSAAAFLALREEGRAFTSVATYSAPKDGFSYISDGAPVQVYGAYVSADFFSVLGVSPLLGRAFQPGEDSPNAEQSVVISHSFWQRYFGGDPQAVGRVIKLQDMSLAVIGVMPSGFWFPRGDRAEFWVNRPITLPTRNGPFVYSAIGRLKPNFTPAQAQSDLDRIAALVRERFPGNSDDWTITAPLLKDKLVEDMRPALLLLMGAVAMVLLIACVNVANLMLARASAREREMAVRTALGASRWRLIRQLLTESIVLATISAAASLILAKFEINAFHLFIPRDMQVLQDMQMQLDGKVFAVTALVALASGVLSGLAPALLSLRNSLSAALNEGGRSGMDSRNRRRLRSSLVVAEFALSFLLLISASLLIRSLVKLQSVDPGIRTENVITMTLTLPDSRYDQDERVAGFYQNLLTSVRSLPGVKSASISYALPPNQLRWSNNFKVEGDSTEPDREPVADNPFVDTDYFNTLGIKLLRGRPFDQRDRAGAPPVVIINEMLARKYFPNEDPIGKRLRIGDTSPKGVLYTVAGVVSNVKYNGLSTAEDLTIYTPFLQAPQSNMFLIVSTVNDPRQIVPSVRREVVKLDSQLALANIETMDRLMHDSVALPRLRTLLLSLFAVLAVVLACIGVYGVLSYLITQRTREIGIRMALGARQQEVVKLVVKQGMAMSSVGVAIGLIASIFFMRFMETFLYGVSPTDLLTYSGVAVALTLIALLACYIPARRAAKTNPIIALRYE